MGVDLGRAHIRMTHLILDRADIGTPFQQVRREGTSLTRNSTLSPFLCHPHPRAPLRHSNRPAVARPQRPEHHDDLHPRAAIRAHGGAQPSGPPHGCASVYGPVIAALGIYIHRTLWGISKWQTGSHSMKQYKK
jgi:hypothetical protein